MLAEILQPRATEIFTLFHDEIVRAGFDKMLNAGVVLTGGGSLLPGMTEVAEQVFDMPVRQGLRPAAPSGLVETGDREPAALTGDRPGALRRAQNGEAASPQADSLNVPVRATRQSGWPRPSLVSPRCFDKSGLGQQRRLALQKGEPSR